MSVEPKDLVPVPISDFITGRSTPVSVYIKLSDQKVVLLAKSGDQLELEQLERYREKNVADLYVHRDEYSKFIDQGLRIAGILLKHKELSYDKKTQLLAQATKNAFDGFARLNFNSQSYAQAKAVTDACVRLVEAKPDLLALLKSISEINKGAAAHAMAVSALSVMIGKRLSWINQATIEKLALGGLLIDVGQKEVPPHIINKRRLDLTHEERTAFESHPFRGAMILQSIGIVPDDVISIVYEHHETATGFGFPRRLKDLKMHPLGKVVCLANAFCELTFEVTEGQVLKTAQEALDFIEKTMGQPFNKQVFQALKEVVENPESVAA